MHTRVFVCVKATYVKESNRMFCVYIACLLCNSFSIQLYFIFLIHIIYNFIKFLFKCIMYIVYMLNTHKYFYHYKQ